MNDINRQRLAWRKSSRSNGQQECVEIATVADGRVAVRDSKNPTGPILLFTSSDFAAFTRSIRGDA